MDSLKGIYTKATEEKLRKVLNETFIDNFIAGFSIVSMCKTHGLVRRTEGNTNHCGNSECEGCNQIEEEIKKLIDG